MLFTYRDEFREKYWDNCDLFDKVSFYDSRVIRLCQENIDTERLAKTLNTINNQGIERINPLAGTFIIKGDVVPISRLSTGEKIFFIADIYTQLGRQVGFGYCIHQLTGKTLRKFYNTFNSDCIAIVADDVYDKEVLHDAYLNR